MMLWHSKAESYSRSLTNTPAHLAHGCTRSLEGGADISGEHLSSDQPGGAVGTKLVPAEADSATRQHFSGLQQPIVHWTQYTQC